MKPFRILQVEDNSDDVFLLDFAFRRAGVTYLIQVARDGQEATDYLEGVGKYADPIRFPVPNLILLDLKMLGRNGFEVLEWIRAQPETMRLIVIIFTSSANKGDVQRAYQLGANAFIVKPSNSETLIELVKALLAFWANFNQFPLESNESDAAIVTAAPVQAESWPLVLSLC